MPALALNAIVMKHYVFFCILLAGFLMQVSPLRSWSVIPPYPVAGGVSAPFAGFVNGRLVVAGGCNFPDVPAADGGSKRYYKECYALRVSDSCAVWQKVCELPVALAYGCSVATPGGLLCIGGANADSSSASVWLLSETDCSGRFECRQLPSLPEAVDNASATCVDGVVYLAGGNRRSGSRTLYSLCPATDTCWQALPAYPGQERLQPVLLGCGDTLYLAGGYCPASPGREAEVACEILRYHIGSRKWLPGFALPPEADGGTRCLVGGAGTADAGRLILTGGVNATIFKAALNGQFGPEYLRQPPSWYRFNDDILLFDVRTHTWHVERDVRGMARAGGVLLLHQGILYMVCGEVKPGIRSSKITSLSISGIKNK